jgi:LPXTG-site transpeptidase (sortase) family protein
MSNSIPSAAPRRSRWGTLFALLLAAVLIVAAVSIVASPTSDINEAAPTATAFQLPPPLVTHSHSTPAAPQSSPSVALPVAIPAAAEPTRLQIPSASIDIAVAILPDASRVDSVVMPPEDPSFVYWMPEFGQADEYSQALIVIAAHSGPDDKWVFNRLSDELLVKVGDIITVTTDNGVLTYRIVATEHLVRNNFEPSVHVMNAAADDLVLISCFTRDLQRQNRVVVAKLVRP